MTGHYDNRFNTPILIMHSSLGYVCISLRVYVYITIYMYISRCVCRVCRASMHGCTNKPIDSLNI